jgi:PBP1b-binding outer membrane lipoprotein LpoB
MKKLLALALIVSAVSFGCSKKEEATTEAAPAAPAATTEAAPAATEAAPAATTEAAPAAPAAEAAPAAH